MNESRITIGVLLDKDKIPQQITWSASGSSAEKAQKAKAMLVSFWDGSDKAALRIDLWTKEMMVDEMADFYYQTLMTMADTYERATHQDELVNDMKQFASKFYAKFKELQTQNKQSG
jgi:gliding motility-associated protein GldC